MFFISVLCVILLAANSLYVFADVTANVNPLDSQTIKVNKEDLRNGAITYGLTIENDGSVSAQAMRGIFNFGIESYDGTLEVQAWEGTQIWFSIRLQSTNSKMLAHTGTIAIHKVGFLGIIGDLYNSQNFSMRNSIATPLLSETYKMYVGNENEIYIKLTNLRVTRTKDGMVLSMPNAQKKIDKADY